MAANPQLIEEDQANGRIRDIYGDIKRVMSAPIVGDVFRACAVSPPLLESVWRQAKPLVGAEPFESLADRIRAHALASARQHFWVPDHSAALSGQGMRKNEVDRLREAVETFHQLDPRLLVVTAIVKELLSSGPVGQAGLPRKVLVPAGDASLKAEISLVSPDALPAADRELLEEMRYALEADFVPVEFRALARWPRYLPLAWHDLKAQVRSAEFRRHVQEIRAIASGGIRGLPGPVRIDTVALAEAGVGREGLAAVYPVVDGLFRLMAGLVATVALLRLGLNALLEEQLLELEAGA